MKRETTSIIEKDINAYFNMFNAKKPKDETSAANIFISKEPFALYFLHKLCYTMSDNNNNRERIEKGYYCIFNAAVATDASSAINEYKITHNK